MLTTIAKKIFGTKNDRYLAGLLPRLNSIAKLEPQYTSLSDSNLRANTAEFRRRIDNGQPLDELLPEAFAVAREAARRAVGMRPFDVQLIGGIVLHEGRIAEMKTGEGKTLVATMPVYLNALTGRGVHVVTVNDYLARRDAEWMGRVYRALGLSVGVILHDMDDPDRKAAYGSDITYGTNNEFGFDYLRDNMKFRLVDYVQRDLHYAIVDEVDSILIDEARTPLIISGPTEDSTDKYYLLDQIVAQLKAERDYVIDEKARSALLNDDGIGRVEQLLKISNLYDPRHIEIVHHVTQALKAHALFRKDRDYVVKDGEVIIVDEFTGRLMPGRRYSDGLHQALEAKERVPIENENQTLASITFQNYFRMYDKLAGMTGTADTEAEEFDNIYKLDVAVVPTNRPLIRNDYEDLIYKSEEGKFQAVMEEIRHVHEEGRPCLVGTVSIEKSELLSKKLKKHGIAHNVLNAKQHEKEADIIKDAGQPGSVTIATNMAGRGTDIVLGPSVAEKGGLHIIGTERHESRRIDNQLRGRAGRQGDNGSSRFFLSLEDDLMRIFASDRVSGYMDRLGMEEDVPIEHKWITRAIEGAQKRVEARNFDIRKHLLKYDDVMNHQRKIIYTMRREILDQDDISPAILDDAREIINDLIQSYASEDTPSKQWERQLIAEGMKRYFDQDLDDQLSSVSNGNDSSEALSLALYQLVEERYSNKRKEIGEDVMEILEKEIKLRTLDTLWKDHLHSMDQLKEGVGFEGYAQQDPLLVYQRRGFDLFSDLVFRIHSGTVERLYRLQIEPQGAANEIAILEQRHQQEQQQQKDLIYGRGDKSPEKTETVRRDGKKVGRNDPCPCGSGKKYKKCHGA